MDRGLAVFLTVAVGIAITAQAPINSKLGHSIGTIQAASISFVIGLIALLLVAAATGEGFGKLFSSPPPAWYLLGGVLGAALVTVVLLTVRSLGAGGVAAALIGGQLAGSIVIDHFGWLGVDKAPVSVGRIAGVLLLAAGTWLVIAD